MLRNRFFSKATEYYLKGDGAKAKLYSMEAKHYNRLMQEMHTEASQRIFESRSTHEAFIDLHGLHQDEAVQIIEQRLNNLHSNYRGIIYIVTGTGHHSGNSGLSKKASKLKPAVEDYLKSENYRFAETSIVGDKNGGVFAVDLSF
jgi:DNA-nicking Smr family endonuclease